MEPAGVGAAGSRRSVKPVQPYETLAQEKEAVLNYARKHPKLRHRELAWRMVDEDVAYLSPSTVYRILKTEKLVCPWSRRNKRRREEEEKATRPNERWATDVMQVLIGDRHCLASVRDAFESPRFSALREGSD